MASLLVRISPTMWMATLAPSSSSLMEEQRSSATLLTRSRNRDSPRQEV
jgi:hypothetical protein